MPKIHKLLLAIVIGVSIAVLGVIFFLTRSNTSQIPTVVSENPVVTEASIELITRNDAAGFSFQYPKDLVLNPHDEDTKNYAHLEFTHVAHPGSLTIWAKDLPTGISTLVAWVKSDKRFTGANILDTTLSERPAKKILVNRSDGQLLVVGVLDDDVVITIESESYSDDYWKGLTDIIVDSFSFEVVTQGDSQAGGESDYVEPADEEEVLE